MSRKPQLPDAWDDDYESIVETKSEPAEPAAPAKLTKAELKARHKEANRALWESAENPETFHFVEMQKANVPLKSDFKPAVKVLSRKPQAPTIAKPGTAVAGLSNGVSGLKIEDEGEDSEEEERKAEEEKLRRRQEQARIEREEKQRKYAEARERIFGSGGSPNPEEDKRGRQSPTKRGSNGGLRGRGRGRGGRVLNNGMGRDYPQSASSTENSPARPQITSRQLFDPNYAEKPTSLMAPSRDESQSSEREKPIRQPKGPDPSGGAGFAFGNRDAKNSAPVE